MALFKPENDFAQLVDGLEPVTLRRRGTAKSLTIKAAYREQVETQETEPSGGAAEQADAVWHLQLPDEESAPQLGDFVVDQQSNRWTVLEVGQLSRLGRWKCVTRELRIAYGCNDRVDVERAVWEDNGSGPEIVDWKYICTALPVRIQPEEQEIVNASATPPTKRSLYQIILSESITLEPDDRLVAEDGTRYRLQSLQQADRIDVLPIAKVLREENS